MDTEGDGSKTLEALFRLILAHMAGEDNHDVALGPARSACSMPLAQNHGVLKIPQISYWSTSPGLDDRSQYPYFARTIAQDEALMGAAVQWFQTKGWDKIGLLYVNDAYGQAAASAFAPSAGARAGTALKLSEDELKNQILNAGAAPIWQRRRGEGGRPSGGLLKQSLSKSWKPLRLHASATSCV